MGRVGTEAIAARGLCESPVSRPRVSILLTCWNREKTIRETLESVVSQDFESREILLWDDGSTDRSVAIAEEFPEVQIFRHSSNRGVVATRNGVLGKAQGDFVFFVDSDDRLKPGVLTKLVRKMEEKPEDVAFVYGQQEYFGEGRGVSKFPDFDVELLKRKNYIQMTSLFRREPVQEIGFTEGHEPEDYDLVLGLVAKGYRGVLLNEPVMEYRLHRKSISASFDPLSKLKLKEVLARKYPTVFSRNDLRKLRRNSREKLLGSFRHSPKPYSDRISMFRDYNQMIRFFGFSRYGFRFVPIALWRLLWGIGLSPTNREESS